MFNSREGHQVTACVSGNCFIIVYLISPMYYRSVQQFVLHKTQHLLLFPP